jgi:cytochrome c5
MGDAGVVSIPDLGDRVWKTSLLADGAYAVPGKPRQAVTTTASLNASHLRALATITTFFTVPSMGVHPDAAVSSLDDATAIMTFLKAYRSQPFPGTVNGTAAARGASVYREQCASCHGNYSADAARPRLVRFPNWIGRVGTDPLRATAFDAGLAAGVGKTAYRDRIAVAKGSGYVAPPLAGIWASAPYLHNGSVPTLAALLSANERPVRFMVGGHALDLEKVGLRLETDGSYARSYRPFAQPAWIDTRAPGRDNAGHRYGEALSADDKRALIAFLTKL